MLTGALLCSLALRGQNGQSTGTSGSLSSPQKATHTEPSAPFTSIHTPGSGTRVGAIAVTVDPAGRVMMCFIWRDAPCSGTRLPRHRCSLGIRSGYRSRNPQDCAGPPSPSADRRAHTDSVLADPDSAVSHSCLPPSPPPSTFTWAAAHWARQVSKSPSRRDRLASVAAWARCSAASWARRFLHSS